MEEHGIMNTGTRASIAAVFGSELVVMMTDSRWMLLAIVVCVLADFRFGWGESAKRYKEAKSKSNEILMAQYKWRTSRAVRRSVNKFIDYFIWVVLGMIIGVSVLKPLGVDYIFGGVGATIISVACEAKSIIGHFMYLHGVAIGDNTIKGFIKAFAVSLARRKNQDVGDALEDGFNNMDKTNNRDNEVK